MINVYAYKGLYQDVMKSSSGAAFLGLCKVFLEKFKNKEVYFYGATFNERLDVVHRGVDNLDECVLFQGSKYVRSECKGIYKDIELKLEEGHAVLFSGTPCQVHSLKKYIEKNDIDNEKLLLIDIICHGVPKPIVWKDYKKWLEAKNNSALKEYSFRYKKEGWKAYPAYARFESGKTLNNTSDLSIYTKLFMKKYSISKGCFSCRFSNMNRVGDITIGDFWGIENIKPNFPSKNGVTLILANTGHGEKITNSLKIGNNEIVLEKIDSNRFINYQHNLQKPTEEPIGYDSFWYDYKNSSFDDIIKKYLGYGTKYKIIFSVKKFIRKTPLINTYRKLKNR